MYRQVTQFLDYMVKEKDCSANTTAAYQNDLTQFVQFVSDYQSPTGGKITSWREVDEHVVQNYLLFLKEQEYASSTVARKVASVKSFLHYLSDMGQITKDPSKRLDFFTRQMEGLNRKQIPLCKDHHIRQDKDE